MLFNGKHTPNYIQKASYSQGLLSAAAEGKGRSEDTQRPAQ